MLIIVYFTDYCRNQIDRELVEYYNTIGSNFRNLSMKISMTEPVTLWEPDCYESNTITFLPVQSIISRTASLVDRCTLSNSSHENVLLVCRIVE